MLPIIRGTVSACRLGPVLGGYSGGSEEGAAACTLKKHDNFIFGVPQLLF